MNSSLPTSAVESVSQSQFLSVVSRDEAERRFREHVSPNPVGIETVPLLMARGRVLAERVISAIDVPGFDRSNVDGLALRAADVSTAGEETPVRLRLNPEVLVPGAIPVCEVAPGTATSIATGGMIPRGADAVVMIEHADVIRGTKATSADQPFVEIRRSAVAGQHIAFAGTDIARGETVAWPGLQVSAREIGILAAVGRSQVAVYQRPQVAILSTGDEVVPPGEALPPGCVFDSNASIIAASVLDCGGEPILLGGVRDDEHELERRLAAGLECDVVILSGGTSKGAGDLSYRVVSRLTDPGIVVHGVALKPGKPVCLAATRGKPVVVLPGFPTSAIFTFHEFVAPVIRQMAGLPAERPTTLRATLPLRVNSERGRTEYNLVALVPGDTELVAYPVGKGSGSITTFSHADGFLTIDQHTELVEAGSEVMVTLLDAGLKPADLVVIGSQCVGLDWLLAELRQTGLRVKSLAIGSLGGVQAAARGECDLAGTHLLDAATGTYNRTFIGPDCELVVGYERMQGLVFRAGTATVDRAAWQDLLRQFATDPARRLVNRNAGSGTRILLDRLLEQHVPPDARRPAGYDVQVKSHNAVAAAIIQGRADWGLAIETVARDAGLSFVPIQPEQFDFVIPRSRRERPAVRKFLELLKRQTTREELERLGFRPCR